MSQFQKSYNSDNKVVQYALEHSLRQHDVQRALAAETMEHPRARMQGAPEVLQLTANLMRSIGAKRVLDIGVYTGCSALSAALALPTGGEVFALDVSEEYLNIGKPYFAKAGVADKIKIHIAPANDTLQKLIDQGMENQFDFAFIDADKTNYCNYLEKCLVLLRSGGIIAVDNTLWGERVLDDSDQSEATAAIRAFNDKVKDDPRVDISFLTIADGLTLLFVR